MPFDYKYCLKKGLLRKIPSSHNDQYDLSFFSTKEDAENALKSANEFSTAMESLFKAV